MAGAVFDVSDFVLKENDYFNGGLNGLLLSVGVAVMMIAYKENEEASATGNWQSSPSSDV